MNAHQPTTAPLILASASPRRRELLARLGLPFVILPSAIDETAPPNASPAEVAKQLALAKAQAIAAQHPDQFVIGADTVVALPGTPPRLLGKPLDDADAIAMLQALRDRWHQVSTGLAIVRGTQRWHTVVTADVRMGNYRDDEIVAYVATGEPHDKAGAYAIQGLAGRLVAEVRGSELAVVGLPLRHLAELLRTAGVILPLDPDTIRDAWQLA